MIKVSRFLFAFILLSGFYALSEENVFETPEEFTDDFLQTFFESENWDQPELLFEEVKDYFDFHIIGRYLLMINIRKFSREQFNVFVEVFSKKEFERLFKRLDNNLQNINYNVIKITELEKKSGTLFSVDYSLNKLETTHSSSTPFAIQKFSIEVFKRKDQDDYKIVNLGFNSIDFIVNRRSFYKSIASQYRGSPEKIIERIRNL